MQVKKRDGKLKDFSPYRIIEVITRAYKDVYQDELDDYQDEIKDVSDKVVIRISTFAEDDGIIEVETIQDIIINELNKINRKVGRAYKKYRIMREEIREKNSKKEQFYKEILQTSNVDNDNANVDQYSFSGRKYRIADNEQKMFAMRNLISPEVREAFEDGYIYIHDASSYAIGDHNCLFADLPRLLGNGFRTRNGDVRPANSFSTACQLVAVIFQVQSQIQYGGVASCGIDYELEPYAHKSFVKLFKEGLFEKDYITENDYNKLKEGNDVKSVDGILIVAQNIHIDNHELKDNFEKAYDYAIRHLEKEGKQAAQGLFHNLNTLESRAGSQVPFTSLNYGRNSSTYGRLICKWLLEASIDGIGKHNRTSIFPISIFQYKKGVNDKKGTVNYDLKRKAIESLSKRIYPNWVNEDWTENVEDPNDYTTFCATMGKCKLQLI